jgi:hypothetical protein
MAPNARDRAPFLTYTSEPTCNIRINWRLVSGCDILEHRRNRRSWVNLTPLAMRLRMTGVCANLPYEVGLWNG